MQYKAKERHDAQRSPRSRPRATQVLLASGVPILPLLVLMAGSWVVAREPERGKGNYAVVRTLPHDPHAFTQGLVYHKGLLYESTGGYGTSSLRRTELMTGKILQIEALPRTRFGEGIALCGDRIVQLTWRAGVGYVRDRKTFRVLREFRYEGEGWGLTYDGKRLIMSDGTATLRFLDPETLEVTGRFEVTNRGRPLRFLNELEMVRGEIYANVFQSHRIARISPRTGHVVGWIDLSGLQRRAAGRATPGHRLGVLNGIAYDAKGDRLFVTGKQWPALFEIEVDVRDDGH